MNSGDFIGMGAAPCRWPDRQQLRDNIFVWRQLLENLKKAMQPAKRSGFPGLLAKFLGWRTPIVALPRGEVHRLKLVIKGVPSRFVSSSLRLQLRQMLGNDKFGFAYSVQGDTATLWYWSEGNGNSIDRLRSATAGDEGFAPWPEPLLRPALDDGLHLIKCLDGYEAVSVVSQEDLRTRWFAVMPTDEAWATFVRDAGADVRHHPLPAPREINIKLHPARGWKLSTGLIRSVPSAVWIGAVTVAIAGLMVAIGGAYSFKLDSAISAEREKYEALSKEHAVTIGLQKQIDEKSDYLKGFSGLRTSYSQLELMTSLIESGVISEGGKISLSEWEFRNNRLRMLFAVPQDDFSLGLFLTVLEKQPVFRDIKLMTDTPPGTVGIQALVVSPASMGASEGDGRSVKTSISAGRNDS